MSSIFLATSCCENSPCSERGGSHVYTRYRECVSCSCRSSSFLFSLFGVFPACRLSCRVITRAFPGAHLLLFADLSIFRCLTTLMRLSHRLGGTVFPLIFSSCVVPKCVARVLLMFPAFSCSGFESRRSSTAVSACWLS